MPSPGRFKGGALSGESSPSSNTAAPLKLRALASIAQAKVSNPITNTPWFKPAVWAPNTLYGQGLIRASTDGLGQWLCVASGTSATAGNGPVGVPSTANAALWGWVQDGTAWWEYHGPIRGQNTAAAMAAGVLTYGTSATITALFSRPKSIVPSPTNPRMLLNGGKFLADPNPPGTLGAPYWWPVIGTTQGQIYNNGFASATFWTDADVIGFMAQVGLYPYQDRCAVEINDTLLVDGQIGHNTPAGNNGNSAFGLNLSYLNASSGPVKKLKIRLPWNGQAWEIFNSITVESNASIWTEATASWSIAFEGDSLSGGGNGAPMTPGTLPPDIAAALLGADAYWNNAVGGTGFINPGSSTTYIQRVDQLAAQNADVYVINGCVNDASSTSASRVAAISLYLKTLRGLIPATTPIVVRGNNLLRDANYAQFVAAEQDLLTAVSTVADPYVFFSPNLTATNYDPTFTGAGGRASAPTYAGNCDQMFSGANGSGNPSGGAPDQHPLMRGYRQIGLRDAKAIEQIIKQL